METENGTFLFFFWKTCAQAQVHHGKKKKGNVFVFSRPGAGPPRVVMSSPPDERRRRIHVI